MVADTKRSLKWTLSWLNGCSVFELDSVQTNVAIEATRLRRLPHFADDISF